MISNRKLAAAAGAILCALGATLGAAPALAAPEDFGAKIDYLVADAVAATTGGQCGKAVNDRIKAALADPRLDGLEPARREGLYYIALECGGYVGPDAVASATKLDAVATKPYLKAVANLVLLIDARTRKDAPAAVAAFDKVFAAEPAALNDVRIFVYYQMLRLLDDDPATRLRVVSKLRAAPWTGADEIDAARNDWALIQAQLAADAGDLPQAKAALEKADDPAVLLSAAEDRRFAPLWPALEKAGRFDWIPLAQARLAMIEARSAAEPRALRHVQDRIDALRALGRFDDAVALGADYDRRLLRNQAFDDADERAPWVLNSYAYALAEVGRIDDADKIMARATGDDTVSQRINRAEMLITAGRPAAALAVLETVETKHASPFGLLWLASNRACALAATPADPRIAADLAKLRDGWKENPSALTQALLCLGRDDEAAALYIRRLEDPTLRRSALEAFRKTKAPPAQSDHVRAFLARRDAILSRPDVLAVQGKYGRVVTAPLSGVYWGDL
ncbi:MAG: hypothetical protein QM608_07495 [Caulobacter sp.]